mmetsp:Transcript_10467/g.10534  ORF Transcript_10467/g.10534 Transcript_10467/m.10534 type:complete len:173 (+) Transcript_10467:81-599(+)|eukprot:CAMPEP_0182418158 /NCGR_PEP_ID=MMETSP1167-20130531/2624_1 /TAXON_ID=2988 /ORGANISM="Mallomonas Sp, Strain CCMP3275" /LENGTH=172 /DNA_ID=CAMNT_0024592197 /DNA_START=79 /DNA_END=597 /DNA_ORIENTATION=-
MGCCSGCMRPANYKKIPENLPVTNTDNQNEQSINSSPHMHQPANGEDTSIVDIYEGAEIMRKFSNSATYQQRFVWVEASTKTIHMSEHMNKNRRHKKANLVDVTSIKAGKPMKWKKRVSSEFDKDDFTNCLTINFRRGEGVDFEFKSAQEREAWQRALSALVEEFASETERP